MLKHKKLISIVATLAFCLSFLAPALMAPAPALAATGITALRVPTVEADDNFDLGTVKVTVPAGAIESGDVVVFTLPDDCDFGDYSFEVPEYISGSDNNGLYGVLYADANYDKGTITITADGNQSLGDDGVFYIYLYDIYVGDVEDGDLIASFDGPSTGFPLGDVVVARTASGSEVKLSVSGADTSNEYFTFDLKIVEKVRSAVEGGADSIVLTLPDGFVWEDYGYVDTIWGDESEFDISWDEEELVIDLPVGYSTSIASAWEIIDLEFSAVDEDFDEADIMMKVNGETNVVPSELKVGTFGEFGVTIACDDPTDVLAGQINQEIGDFTIEETISESLILNRTITLELPVWAKWTKIDNIVRDSGTTLEFAGIAGSEGNVIKYRITHVGSSTAELDFEGYEVAIDAVPAGDLTVTVGGNSGLEDEVVVAKVLSPVTIAPASVPPEVKIGATAQIADLLITEGEAGAIEKKRAAALGGGNAAIYLKLPAGCEWAKIPTIEVTSGDLKLDLANVRKAKFPLGGSTSGWATTDFYQYLVIPVERDSNDASTIKISNNFVTIDRTVPEGNLIVALLGDAVLASNTYPGDAASTTLGNRERLTTDFTYSVGSAGMFPQTLALTGTLGAKVASTMGGQINFYIGSTVYTVGGNAFGMDAAPYIKAGRTLTPVRFVADALNAATAWDAATKTVTVTKGDKSIVLVIGSTIAKVNGVDVTMEVAPEIIAPGRTMLPTRYVAEALGHTVLWNAALNQVIIQ